MLEIRYLRQVIRQTGHGRQADISSLGATILEMATGKPPWAEYSSQVAAMFHIAVSEDPPQYPVRCKDYCQWLFRLFAGLLRLACISLPLVVLCVAVFCVWPSFPS